VADILITPDKISARRDRVDQELDDLRQAMNQGFGRIENAFSGLTTAGPDDQKPADGALQRAQTT
jgi:hypothetical protein